MTEGKENNKQIKEQAQAKKNAPKVRFLTGGVAVFRIQTQ